MNMKAVIKYVLYIKLMLVVTQLQSCCENGEKSFEWTGLQLKNLDNSFQSPFISENSIPKGAYGIRLATDLEPSIVEESPCDSYSETRIADIDSILITCNTSPDSIFEEGQVLNQLFSARNSFFNGPYSTINDMIDRFNKSNEIQFECDFYLMEEPGAGGLYEFKISIFLNNADTLSEITSVKLN